MKQKINNLNDPNKRILSKKNKKSRRTHMITICQMYHHLQYKDYYNIYFIIFSRKTTDEQ